MGKALKWAGIGCGGLLGLLLLIIIIAALVSGGGSDENEVSVAENAPGGGTATEVRVPDGKERTNALPRGYSITHDGFKVTVLDVSYSSSEGGIFATLKEDNVWAIVKLRLEAVGDPNKTYSYNTFDFRIVGDKGTIYDDWFIPSTDDALGSAEVFGGAVVEGNVVQQ
ncbi:MAG: DUF4352 domain-containing protein, partial [Chloroflexota bacterium]|nr:DUF4352 domain-containing protein [Chloroflexota bacterium]